MRSNAIVTRTAAVLSSAANHAPNGLRPAASMYSRTAISSGYDNTFVITGNGSPIQLAEYAEAETANGVAGSIKAALSCSFPATQATVSFPRSNACM